MEKGRDQGKKRETEGEEGKETEGEKEEEKRKEKKKAESGVFIQEKSATEAMVAQDSPKGDEGRTILTLGGKQSAIRTPLSDRK